MLDMKIKESACVDVASSIFFLIKLWFVESLFIVLLIFALILHGVLTWMMILNISSSVVLQIDLLSSVFLPADYCFLVLIVFIQVVVFGLFVVLRLLQLALLHMLWCASLLLLPIGLLWLHSSTFDKQWSLEDLGVNFNHFVLVVHFLLFLISLELLDLVSDDCPRTIDVYVVFL